MDELAGVLLEVYTVEPYAGYSGRGRYIDMTAADEGFSYMLI